MLNTILGSFSSGVAASTSSYESIASVTVGSGGASNVEFTSIPATYTHLQIRGIAQTNRSGYVVDVTRLRFNSDTSTNYSAHNLYGGYTTSPSVTANADVSSNSIDSQGLNSGVATNVFTASIIDILDYANTNKYKTVRVLQGFDVNGTTGTGSYGGTIDFSSGNWRSTSAITSITIFMYNGTLFNQYTQFALYGIKGA